ncbi:MAG: LysM peptidoglycan-binding domain-containing protein [Oscillospiraceae bacterium]|nr:LysM peptidoglycan-binding domain-containing protein [Oscillospiraceae bacterium]
MDIYLVRQGDTVSSIAEKYNISNQRLITDNSLYSDGRLVTGQALLILKPEIVHTFRSGDSLFSVASTYGTDVLQLYRNNPLIIGTDNIPVGTQIVIKYENAPEKSIRTSGFAYDYINRDTFRAALPYLTYLILFGYGFNDDGTIIEPLDDELIPIAHEFRTVVFISLTSINQDGTFNSAKIERIVTDTDFQNIVLTNLIEVIKRKNAQGLDIDMEYIPPQYRNGFTAFVSNASRRLHEAGLILHVDLAPKTSDEQSGLLYEAHDYSALGAVADFVFLMTYEWGYAYGPPMAVAPLPNVRNVLEYALTEIDADKIFLGIPNYGYNWKLPFVRGESKAVTIGNVNAVRLALAKGSEILYDEQAQSPYFYYTDPEGAAHVVWFDDVRSMNEKYRLVSEKQILGCGYWNLMRPFRQNYLLLNSLFNIEKLYP